MSKAKLEYIWLDGYKPTQNMRSKTKVVDEVTIDSTTTVSKVTSPINPKLKGLKDRKERFQKAKESINCL